MCDTRWVFEAIPVQYLRSVFLMRFFFTPDQVLVVLSKGIEKDTLLYQRHHR